MVAVITRPRTARSTGARPSALPGPIERPRLVLVPGGRGSTPTQDVCVPRGGARVTPIGHLVSPRPSRPVLRRRRIIAAFLVVVGVVAGLWIVVHAIGGIGGWGRVTSSDDSGASVSAVASGSATGAFLSSTESAQHPVPGQIWVVRPGDTLWGIVAAAGVQGDPRPVVDLLSASLDGQPLQVGQSIRVP